MISRPNKSATYHLWDRFAPHSWCVADSHIPFASLLSRSAPQFVIWRGYAGRLIILKGFSNPTGLYRQDYYIPLCFQFAARIRFTAFLLGSLALTTFIRSSTLVPRWPTHIHALYTLITPMTVRSVVKVPNPRLVKLRQYFVKVQGGGRILPTEYG